MTGTFKAFDAATSTMTFADDTDHKIAPGATVTLNGKPSALGSLKAGDTVSLSGDPATSVSATRP